MMTTANNEKSLGMVAGGLASGVAYAGFALATSLGMSSQAALVLCLQLGGFSAAFVLDHLIAKRMFRGEAVPYSALGRRFVYMLRATVSPVMLRYISSILIDTLVVVQVFELALRELDRRGVRFRFRDLLVGAFITGVSYILFSSMLRFDWALVDGDGPPLVLDFVVGTCLALCVLIAAGMENLKKAVAPGRCSE